MSGLRSSSTAPVAAVVPINRLERVKSRLAPVLSADERRALVLWMGERTLAAMRASERVGAFAVVSPDPAVLAWAKAHGATPLEQREGTLNDGLALGRAWATEQGAQALLVTLADLPLLRGDEIAAALDLLWTEETDRPGSVTPGTWVLAPDRAGKGTNLLVACPVARAPLLFGPASLPRFERAAALAGIPTRILISEGTRFDVDIPADIEELRGRGLWRPPEERATRLG